MTLLMQWRADNHQEQETLKGEEGSEEEDGGPLLTQGLVLDQGKISLQESSLAENCIVEANLSCAGPSAFQRSRVSSDNTTITYSFPRRPDLTNIL